MLEKDKLIQEEMNRISNYINKQKGQSYPCSNQIVICGIVTHTQE